MFLYIWCMKTVIHRGNYTHHLVKKNRQVAMYNTCIDDEIIGYEVLIKGHEPGLSSLITMQEAEAKFIQLTERVKIVHAGHEICMN